MRAEEEKMQEQPNFQSFVTPAALAFGLADTIAAILKEAVAVRGHASLVVPGGKSPILFFQALHKSPLDWKKIYVTLTDERWVPTNTDPSNEKTVRKYLLPPENRFIGLKNSFPNPEAGGDHCRKVLEHFPKPFDALVLGMGEDGHIASLFPDAPKIKTALDPINPLLCMAMVSPTASHLRMSMTFSGLMRSKHIFLLITGKKKREVLEQALKPGDIEALPVRTILFQKKVPVDIFWAPGE